VVIAGFTTEGTEGGDKAGGSCSAARFASRDSRGGCRNV